MPSRAVETLITHGSAFGEQATITIALVVVLLAGNSAFGQFILTVDLVQRRHSLHDQKDQREQVASISVSVKPGNEFFAKTSVGGGKFAKAAKASVGCETVKLIGPSATVQNFD